MIDIKCSTCKRGFQVDIPRHLWNADLATRIEWAVKKQPPLTRRDEELLIYRICDQCWAEDFEND